MAGFYVRDKYLYGRSRNGVFSGREVENPGRILYVAPTTAYVSGFPVGSAQSWAREINQFVYNNINAAYADAQDGRGDAIVLLPGTHTLTANIAWAKAGITIFGPDAWLDIEQKQRPSAKIVPLAGSAGFTITAPDTTFTGVECVPVTTQNFASFSAAAARLRILNCYLDLETAAVNTGTQGFVATGAAPNVHVSKCMAVSGGAQGFAFGMVACPGFLIEDSAFLVSSGTWATAIKTGSSSVGVIRRCYFGGTGTSISGVVSTAAGESTNAIRLNDNRLGVGHTLASGYGAANGKCTLANNYIETISGGLGGTLITVST